MLTFINHLNILTYAFPVTVELRQVLLNSVPYACADALAHITDRSNSETRK